MFDNNKRRRDKNRIKNAGTERRGRPPSRHTKALSDEEWEFVQQVEKYKAKNNIRFLSYSGILEMITEFGYRKEVL